MLDDDVSVGWFDLLSPCSMMISPTKAPPAGTKGQQHTHQLDLDLFFFCLQIALLP